MEPSVRVEAEGICADQTQTLRKSTNRSTSPIILERYFHTIHAVALSKELRDLIEKSFDLALETKLIFALNEHPPGCGRPQQDCVSLLFFFRFEYYFLIKSSRNTKTQGSTSGGLMERKQTMSLSTQLVRSTHGSGLTVSKKHNICRDCQLFVFLWRIHAWASVEGVAR